MSKLKAGTETRRIAQRGVENPDEAMASKAVVVTGGGWRNLIPPDSRQRIVDEIMETLMRLIPYSGREELLELHNTALRFEENIYTTATCQTDYVRKISLKILMIEVDPAVNAFPSNVASSSQNPQDPGERAALTIGGINMQVAQRQVQIPVQVMGRGAEAATGIEVSDWRTVLQPESRLRIVNKIMECLKRHLPCSGTEGMVELNKIAVRFEEKIYTAAESQSDYLRKISLKMLTMETRNHNPLRF